MSGMLDLYRRTTILVDLRFTIHWDAGNQGQTFAPVAFAAELITEDLELFIQSLDAACLERIHAVTKYTMYRFDKPVNFEVERSFVWKGLEKARLSIRGLSSNELWAQLQLMKKRGYQDCVRVDMAVEIEAGEELQGQKIMISSLVGEPGYNWRAEASGARKLTENLPQISETLQVAGLQFAA